MASPGAAEGMVITSAPYFLAIVSDGFRRLGQLGVHLVAHGLHFVAKGLRAHFLGQLILHFLEGLELGGLFFHGLNDVITELRGHHSAQFFRLERESHAVEFRHHLIAHEPAQIAAVFGGSVLGVLLGQLREIRPALELLQQIRRPWRASAFFSASDFPSVFSRMWRACTRSGIRKLSSALE